MLAEGALQSADLLRGELGPQPSLLAAFPLAVIAHLALGARGVPAAIWREQQSTLIHWFQIDGYRERCRS